MQNALKTIQVSGDSDSAEDTSFVLSGGLVEQKPNPISVSAEEVSSATMMVASLERSRLEPHRKVVEDLENSIASLTKRLAEEKEKLASKKKILSISIKSFGRVRTRLDKLKSGDMTFDEFVSKLNS